MVKNAKITEEEERELEGEERKKDLLSSQKCEIIEGVEEEEEEGTHGKVKSGIVDVP